MSLPSQQRYALVTFSDRGHSNVFVALAQRLEGAGHEVVLVSVQDPLDAQARTAGLAARTLCVAPQAHDFAPPARRSAELGRLVGNPRWLARWLSGVLVEPLPVQVEALRAALRAHRPDAVIVDAMAYAGAIAAELERLPWAAAATTLQSLPPPPSAPRSSAPAFAALDAARAERVARLGVELCFRGSDVLSPRLNVMFASPSLLTRGGVLLPPEVHAVGAALPTQALGARNGGGPPLVYVAFGSHLSPPAEVYQAIGAALHAEEAEIVMALKDLIGEPFVSSLPAHVRAVQIAPQLELLARARVMVHHGGANSVMECLAYEVPSIALPLGYDQPTCAAIIERAGIGRAIELDAPTARWRELLLALLRADAPEREACRRCDAREDGAARAAALIAAME